MKVKNTLITKAIQKYESIIELNTGIIIEININEITLIKLAIISLKLLT